MPRFDGAVAKNRELSNEWESRPVWKWRNGDIVVPNFGPFKELRCKVVDASSIYWLTLTDGYQSSVHVDLRPLWSLRKHTYSLHTETCFDARVQR